MAELTVKETIEKLLETQTMGNIIAQLAQVQDDKSKRERKRAGGQEAAVKLSKVAVLLRRVAITIDEVET